MTEQEYDNGYPPEEYVRAKIPLAQCDEQTRIAIWDAEWSRDKIPRYAYVVMPKAHFFSKASPRQVTYHLK